MTVRREKKIRKQRGSRTYGYGRISGGHRKGGSHGGKGNAGIKDHHQIGRIVEIIQNQKGFTNSSSQSTDKTINIGAIDEQIDSLISNKIAKKKGKIVEIDVTELGYTKVMGKGFIRHPLHIYAKKFTSHAQEKIEAAGGKVFPK